MALGVIHHYAQTGDLQLSEAMFHDLFKHNHDLSSYVEAMSHRGGDATPRLLTQNEAVTESRDGQYGYIAVMAQLCFDGTVHHSNDSDVPIDLSKLHVLSLTALVTYFGITVVLPSPRTHHCSNAPLAHSIP